MGVKILERISPEYKKFMDTLRELERLEVAVGYQHGQAAEDDGTDICDVAAWNEFGTETIPSRPFMRTAYDDNIDKINALIAKEYMDVLRNGKSADQVMKEIGIAHKGQIQKTIRDGDFAPNAESTIRKKGSSKPLIDTGRMRQSVNYVVRPKGSGER